MMKNTLSVTNVRREHYCSVVTVCEVDVTGARDGFEDLRVYHESCDASDTDAGDIDDALESLALAKGLDYR